MWEQQCEHPWINWRPVQGALLPHGLVTAGIVLTNIQIVFADSCLNLQHDTLFFWQVRRNLKKIIIEQCERQTGI